MNNSSTGTLPKRGCNTAAYCRSLRRLYTGTICILALLVGPLLAHAEQAWNLGMIGNQPSILVERFMPLMAYMNQGGLHAGKIIAAKSLDEMIDLFEEGKVDFMFESAFGALKIIDATGAIPILIREKKGVREYRSAIFVSSDSQIKSIPDLNGKLIAFEDPTSTSSFVLPSELIRAAGLSLVESNFPTPGKISYYFTGNDYNTILQVRKGKKANAGGIKLSRIEGKTRFRVLTPHSVAVPRHVVLVRKGRDPLILEKILLKLSDDPSAKSILKRAKTATGFSRFNGDPAKIMNTTIRTALGLQPKAAELRP